METAPPTEVNHAPSNAVHNSTGIMGRTRTSRTSTTATIAASKNVRSIPSTNPMSTKTTTPTSMGSSSTIGVGEFVEASFASFEKAYGFHPAVSSPNPSSSSSHSVSEKNISKSPRTTTLTMRSFSLGVILQTILFSFVPFLFFCARRSMFGVASLLRSFLIGHVLRLFMTFFPGAVMTSNSTTLLLPIFIKEKVSNVFLRLITTICISMGIMNMNNHYGGDNNHHSNSSRYINGSNSGNTGNNNNHNNNWLQWCQVVIVGKLGGDPHSCPPPSLALLALLTVFAFVVHPDGLTWVLLGKLRDLLSNLIRSSKICIEMIRDGHIPTLAASGSLAAIIAIAGILHRTSTPSTITTKQSRKEKHSGSHHHHHSKGKKKRGGKRGGGGGGNGVGNNHLERRSGKHSNRIKNGSSSINSNKKGRILYPLTESIEKSEGAGNCNKNENDIAHAEEKPPFFVPPDNVVAEIPDRAWTDPSLDDQSATSSLSTVLSFSSSTQDHCTTANINTSHSLINDDHSKENEKKMTQNTHDVSTMSTPTTVAAVAAVAAAAAAAKTTTTTTTTTTTAPPPPTTAPPTTAPPPPTTTSAAEATSHPYTKKEQKRNKKSKKQSNANSGRRQKSVPSCVSPKPSDASFPISGDMVPSKMYSSGSSRPPSVEVTQNPFPTHSSKSDRTNKSNPASPISHQYNNHRAINSNSYFSSSSTSPLHSHQRSSTFVSYQSVTVPQGRSVFESSPHLQRNNMTPLPTFNSSFGGLSTLRNDDSRLSNHLTHKAPGRNLPSVGGTTTTTTTTGTSTTTTTTTGSSNRNTVPNHAHSQYSVPMYSNNCHCNYTHIPKNPGKIELAGLLAQAGLIGRSCANLLTDVPDVEALGRFTSEHYKMYHVSENTQYQIQKLLEARRRRREMASLYGGPSMMPCHSNSPVSPVRTSVNANVGSSASTSTSMSASTLAAAGTTAIAAIRPPPGLGFGDLSSTTGTTISNEKTMDIYPNQYYCLSRESNTPMERPHLGGDPNRTKTLGFSSSSKGNHVSAAPSSVLGGSSSLEGNMGLNSNHTNSDEMEDSTSMEEDLLSQVGGQMAVSILDF